MVCISALSVFIIKDVFLTDQQLTIEDNQMPKKKSYKIPLIIAAILLVIIAAALYLLIAPIANIPSWFIPAREAFYASAFYSDFENNFITDARYMYIVKGLGVTFEVTFFKPMFSAEALL